MPTAPSEPFVDWLREHATPLGHLDPAAPLDDLAPLKAAIGTARVVAIGENAHFIREFATLRERLLRYLVEECGFTALAFEYGFSEGFGLDAWARGDGADGDLDDLLAGTVPIGVDGPLRWLRRYNRDAARPVRFAGLDVPSAGGSLLPALEPVADYLRRVDPEIAPTLAEAVRIAGSFAGGSAADAAPRWARLPAAEQNALTAILSRLLVRMRAMEPRYVSRSDRDDYHVAVRRLEGARAGDYGFRAMAELFAGTGLTADTSARDAYLAGSVRWHLDRLGPDARIVLAAHNAHIQTEPIAFDGRLTGLPMGHYLRRELGDGYYSLGLTGSAGHTAEMVRDESVPFGFTIEETALDDPEPGSIEAAFTGAGLGRSLADLRGGPPDAPAPDRIRLQGGYLHTPVTRAFDGMLHVPTTTVTPH
ncbi:erythromycin esterase [Actinocatenispora thailandica]|uniref:Erythromycin esterase n=1 Tax=Actinocatenispora thailandica TaxID=227318 RepID=A0A7R7DVF6_9ACTN|nr:erythromycin esterase family protein [Actinocatenispora thailandica]BCJ38057.1 erythromycin esterase [Actinocatenispora thailandica]